MLSDSTKIERVVDAVTDLAKSPSEYHKDCLRLALIELLRPNQEAIYDAARALASVVKPRRDDDYSDVTRAAEQLALAAFQ